MRTIWNGSITSAWSTSRRAGGRPAASGRVLRTLHRECARRSAALARSTSARRGRELVKGWEFAGASSWSSRMRISRLPQFNLAVDRPRASCVDQVDPIYFDRRTIWPRPRTAQVAPPPTLLLRGPARVADGRGGQVRALGQGESLPGTAARGLAGARAALLRGGHPPGAEIDEACRRSTQGEGPEVAMALQLVESIVGDFDPEDYGTSTATTSGHARGQARAEEVSARAELKRRL